QLSGAVLDTLELLPATELLLTPERAAVFRARYRELFGAGLAEDPLYAAVSEGRAYAGMEHWLPLFFDAPLVTLAAYRPHATLVLGWQAAEAMQARMAQVDDFYAARQSLYQNAKQAARATAYKPVPVDLLYIKEGGQSLLPSVINLSPFAPPSAAEWDAGGRYAADFAAARAADPHMLYDAVLARMREKPIKTLIVCTSAGSADRLHHVLDEHAKDTGGVPPHASMVVLPLEQGFASDDLVVITEQDILGDRIARPRRTSKRNDEFVIDLGALNAGDLVVHDEHGIGRFEGLVAVNVSGATHDCLKLLYDGGDRLFLPVENIEMITRYGMEDDTSQLDKLGGASWQSRKAKLKERITLAAEALLSIAAQRQLKQGTVIETQPGSYDEFCARFAYSETEDQLRAIEDVLADLKRGKPMDRLVCGDVGFGKTEVALRAAFAATAADSASPDQQRHQVAVIVPTTLLARQHYRNFKARFEGFPVNVRQLSRMVPVREQQQVREGLKDGSVDIVVGTHALLAKNIEFKNLALVIVDEEQHFGVAQKEKLKSLKSNVHVLTLSATPIPRTLQMALTGVRDLSLITTPPVDRLAVRSFVLPYDPVVLREALLREKHRGGVSFIVCPRIKDMAEIRLQISELMPELRIATAHGQMTPGELDDIMNDVYDGKVDALLSTAIIESGIDIPTANTMVIFNAHLFGLAQLYQLRGRVGRSKTRAYAYFILPHYRKLTDTATRRLEVMQTLDTLGAGFTLASHDMDIRGFGNLVGEEQSGHIKEVGIELYQQMLEEAVAALKNNAIPSEAEGSKDPSTTLRSTQDDTKDFSPTINLGLSVLIPETYVEDLSLRMGLYRRASQLADAAEIESFAAELIDRFGAMPEETSHLIEVLGLKLLCKKAGIERIDVGPKGAVLSFYKNQFANPEALLAHIDRNPRTLKVRPDQKLVFTHEWQDKNGKCQVLTKLLNCICALLDNQCKAPS
ncbi:MAG: transcription-repair coupling factor, partial [Alphaproteobacteria bacterium]|nr:transcription-repair coupling factor [Alphaproteobacteria bacterium]